MPKIDNGNQWHSENEEPVGQVWGCFFALCALIAVAIVLGLGFGFFELIKYLAGA